MSSGSTVSTAGGCGEDFVPGRKLTVHVAENGHSLEFECDGSTTVEAIQRSIDCLCGIPLTGQLLLCRNTSLDPQQHLAYYKLPQDDREVFLYNKARLHADAPCPHNETINIPEPQLPSLPSPSQCTHPLDNATDPALKALASYEHQFRHHFQLANAIYGSTQAKFEVCKRLLREIQVQERALETAGGNLEHTYKKLQQRCTDFLRCFAQQNRCHEELLANFGRDIERLRDLKLYPALQSNERKCLLDFVKEEELRKWAAVCAVSQPQFEVKVLQLKGNFGELKRRVECVFSGMSSARSKDLEVAIKEHQKILNDQKTVMQSLSKDVNTVKKLVDDCLSCQLSASLCPHDAVSAVGPMYNVHEKNHIPKVQNCDHALSKLLEKCKNKKNEMNSLVHVSMQTIKSVQSSIRDMMNELHAFQEVMGQQGKEFENLKFANGIGHAYRACLAEVVRRKASLKLYMGLAGQLAERLASERDDEIRRREDFFKAWSKYIPPDILSSMGLFDSPSQCDVNIAPFDNNLLDIDVVDVDRFAPVHVVGLLSKCERGGIPKICSTTSSDSSNWPKSKEGSVDAHEKCDSLELLDHCGSVDIAGTSKVEVENAWLKAELASAIALICSFNAEIGYDSNDDGKLDDILKNVKEKTAEALHLKDEYAKHLQSMLEMKQSQCSSYEKRIQELEQRLADQYMQGQKLSSTKDALGSDLSVLKNDDKSEISRGGEMHIPYMSTVPMDEASCTSGLLDPKGEQISGQSGKPTEGGDESMTDLSGTVNMQSGDSVRNMDSSMLEPARDERIGDIEDHRADDVDKDQANDIDRGEKMMTRQVSTIMTNSTSDDNLGEPLNMLPCEAATEQGSESQTRDNLVIDLQNALAEKSKQCDEVENKLKAVLEEVSSLRRELEISQNLLDESQMNCAHLENCLHEAREEAHTSLCAADRRASEYSALRVTAVKMHSLFERFRTCVTAQPGIASFADSLRSLAISLASSANEDEDDGSADFSICIQVLADKVGILARHCAELLERNSRVEMAHRLLVKELEEKKELIKSLYTKRQLEKQANKEKISFGHFEVHELAAFVLNSVGFYEAINRNCSNYFLSAESVALFTEQHQSRPTYIIGQIVHIERRIVRQPVPPQAKHGDETNALSPDSMNRLSPRSLAASNPFDLPIGCEYFIVTVAMLPDTIHSTPS